MPFHFPESLPPQSFSPGLFEQDIMTIPLEAAAVATITYMYTPRSKPLWPFTDETATGNRNPTRHPGRMLGLIGSGFAAGTMTTVGYFAGSSKVWPHFRGWIHTHLLTEIATSYAKNTFQRHRPFYDTEKKLGTLRQDDSKSFFSGHSSHTFAFANYSSALVRTYTTDQAWVGWTYTGAMMGLASWVASARAIDGQHYWSDVITGSVVGFTISSLVFRRVEEVITLVNQDSSVGFWKKVNLTPNLSVTEYHRPVATLQADVTL